MNCNFPSSYKSLPINLTNFLLNLASGAHNFFALLLFSNLGTEEEGLPHAHNNKMSPFIVLSNLQ